MIEKKLKYKQYLVKFPNCPPLDFKEVERDAYRWIHNPLSTNKLNTTNLIRVGDLSYFEGPLLSLFEDISSGHFYLFDWVDRDTKTNRWIIYRVSPKDSVHC